MKQLLLFVLFSFFLVKYSDAQVFEIDKPGQIIPPSPTASSLGGYGGINVGMHTGTPNISIPLHVFKTKHLAIPISLNYGSNGIKVDQVASWVGMGWNLDAGGVITRTVMDKADEDYKRSIPNFDKLTARVQQYLFTIFEKSIDTQPDVFTYSFPGSSGKFVYSEDMEAVTIPLKPISIESDFANKKFTITDANGVQYIFGGTYFETSESTNNCGKNILRVVPTAWYLNKIIHPKGEQINFTYSGLNYTYYTGISQTAYESLTRFVSCNGEFPIYDDQTCRQQLTVLGKQLSEISSPDFGRIKFSTSDRGDLPGCGKLDSVVVYDKTGVELKRFQLEYLETEKGKNLSYTGDPSLYKRIFLNKLSEFSPGKEEDAKIHNFTYDKPKELPARLSYSQDHWGYYNGKRNSYFIPKSNFYDGIFNDKCGNRELDTNKTSKGLLTGIVYPTGGHDSLEYEPNSTYGEQINYPPLRYQYYTMECHVAGGTGVHDDFIFDNPLGQEITFTLGIDLLGTDPRPPANELMHYTMELSVYDIANSSYVFQNEILELQKKDLHIFKYHLDTGSYRLYAKLSGFESRGRIRLQYYASAPVTVLTNIPTGGMRIKRVSSTAEKSAAPIIKRYFYNKFSNKDQSSGTLTVRPHYGSLFTVEQCCGGTPPSKKHYDFAQINSSSLNSLYAVGSSTIYYPYVTVSHGENFENGGIEYKFMTNPDDDGTIVVGKTHIYEAPKSNFGFNNGLQLEERIFKVNGDVDITVRKTINNYSSDPTNVEVRGFFIKKLYEDCKLVDPLVAFYLCTESSITNSIVYSPTKRILWNGKYRNIPYDLANALFPYIQRDVLYTTPCYKRNVGDTIIMANILDHLAGIEYKFFSKWNILESTETTIYDENGNNPLTSLSEFEYHPYSQQVIKTKTTDSKGQQSCMEARYMVNYLVNKNSACYTTYWQRLNESELLFREDLRACIANYSDYTQQETCIDDKILEKNSREDQYNIELRACQNAGSPNYKSLLLMQDKHMLNPPIEKYAYTINELGDTIYKDAVLNFYEVSNDKLNKKSVHRLQASTKAAANFNPSYVDNSRNFHYSSEYEEVLSYDRYDNLGNLLQYTTNAGVPVSIIWSYNNNFPVAKIQGATYAQVEAIVGLNLLDINSAYHSDANLQLKLKPLLSLNQAMVTYSTYDTNYGITSSTDTNGKKTTYAYDHLGRLVLIRDDLGKILKRFQYNYRNN